MRIHAPRSVAVGMLVLAWCAAGGFASWVYMAPELYLDEAEAVVVGKMTNVDAEKGTGTIAVSEVLKGDEDLKEVKARFSAMPKSKDGVVMMRSTAIVYRQGQDGVWVLLRTSRNDEGAYAVNLPWLHYDAVQTEEVKKHLAELAQRPWSEPVGGLSASTLVHQRPGAEDNPLIYVALKNVSDEPIRVSDYRGQRLLGVAIIEPDGARREPDLYSYLVMIRLAPPTVKDLPELAPGEVRYVAFRQGVSSGPLVKEGLYTVLATYRNTDDGKTQKLANVWTGEVSAPPVQLRVGGEERESEPSAEQGVWQRHPDLKKQFNHDMAAMEEWFIQLEPDAFADRYPGIARLLNSDDEADRARAIRAIEALRERSAIPLLAERMGSEAHTERLLATMQLSRWVYNEYHAGHRRVPQRLAPLLPLFVKTLLESGDEPNIRAYCAQAIGCLGHGEWLPLLKDLSSSRYGAVEHWAGWAIQELSRRD